MQEESANSKIIDGKRISKEIENELRIEVENWTNVGHRKPCLAAILVGSDPASNTYVKNKMLAASNIGITSKLIKMEDTSTENDIIVKIKELNNDALVDGILVQLPLPEGVSERNICNAVAENKDIDGFHVNNVGKLFLNMDTFVPATALGVIELLKRTKVETFGKKVVVCGRSKNVGLPIFQILHSDARNACPGMEATVTLCHRHTPPQDLEIFAKEADIIITATGVPGLIKKHMVKPGATIIDVGITRVPREDGKTKLVGDVDFNSVIEVAGAITPVPGGVGPMTVAMLMKNTLKAAKNLATLNGC